MNLLVSFSVGQDLTFVQPLVRNRDIFGKSQEPGRYFVLKLKIFL